MPAVSDRQQRFMGMCAHNPKHAHGKCPSHKVAEEFSHKGPGTRHTIATGDRRRG